MIQQIFDWFKGKRFNLHDEKELQFEISVLLANYISGQDFKREFRLDEKNIIDFFIYNQVGIEIKIKGSKRAIYHQCVRYCEFEKIKSLILITNKSMGFPEQLNGKDCYVLNLGKAWL